MYPIISIVGYSDSGKTTLIEKVVSILSRQGYRVGVLKHTHDQIKADKHGTDTDRFRIAGATISSISDDKLLVRFEGVKKVTPREYISLLSRGIDLLIIEGYKKESFPKILFSDKLPAVNFKGIVATVGKRTPPNSKAKHFKPSMSREIASWMEKEIITPGKKNHRLTVDIDGKMLPMKGFVADIVSQTILGLLGTLKGGTGRKINISIDLGDKI